MHKLDLERARYRMDILKWIVVAIGAVVSFVVIDYGKLKLERFRVTADSQRQLLDSYLKATEAPQPDVWKRKLHILQNFAQDERTQQWAETELKYIETFAGLDALYRETLKVASQLVEPGRLADPDRVQARARFNQLYWADLPYAGESQKVIEAMIAFRQGLLEAEGAPKKLEAWDNLSRRLIELSKALRESTPEYPGRQSPPAAR
jgi:hypothetical protein